MLGLERHRSRFSDEPRIAWREFFSWGFVPLHGFSDVVAPRWTSVALALGGLLWTLAMWMRDRSPAAPGSAVRGYRDDAQTRWPNLGYPDARIEGWIRDESIERSLRTLGVLALTHAPLAVSMLAGFVAGG